MRILSHISALILFAASSCAIAAEQKDMHSAISDYLAEQWGDGQAEWVELSMPDPKLLNAGDRWELEGPEKPRGRSVMYATVMDGNTQLRRIPFRIRVMPFAWTPVAAQPMSRGDVVTSSQVRWERREVTEIRHPWPESPEVLTQSKLRLRRNLQAADVLTWADVEQEPEVCLGEQVSLRMQKGSVVVETEGRALQDGRTGEIIRVEQEELGSLLRVKVIGPNRAEIINVLGR